MFYRYYNLLDTSGGGAIFSCIVAAGYVAAYNLVERGNLLPKDAPWYMMPWKIALTLFVVGWYMQIHPGMDY